MHFENVYANKQIRVDFIYVLKSNFKVSQVFVLKAYGCHECATIVFYEQNVCFCKENVPL